MGPNVLVAIFFIASFSASSVVCQSFFNLNPLANDLSLRSSSPSPQSSSFNPFSRLRNVPQIEIFSGDPQNPSVTRIAQFEYSVDNSLSNNDGLNANRISDPSSFSFRPFSHELPSSLRQSPFQSQPQFQSQPSFQPQPQPQLQFQRQPETLFVTPPPQVRAPLQNEPERRPRFTLAPQPFQVQPNAISNQGFDLEARFRNSQPQTPPTSSVVFHNNRVAVRPTIPSNAVSGVEYIDEANDDRNRNRNRLQLQPQPQAQPPQSSNTLFAAPPTRVRSEVRPQFRPSQPSQPSRPAFEPSFFGFGSSPAASPNSANNNDLLINLYGLEANRTTLPTPQRPSLFRPSEAIAVRPAPAIDTGSPFDFEFPILSSFARENNIQVHSHPNSQPTLRVVRPPISNDVSDVQPLRTPPASIEASLGDQPLLVNVSSLTALKDHLLALQLARAAGGEPPSENAYYTTAPPSTPPPSPRVPSYYQPTPSRATLPPTLSRSTIAVAGQYLGPQTRRPQYRPVLRTTVRPTVRTTIATTERPSYLEDANPGARNVIDEDSVIASYGNPYMYFPDLARLPKSNQSSPTPLQVATIVRATPAPALSQPEVGDRLTVTQRSPSIVPYQDDFPTTPSQIGRFRPAPISGRSYQPEYRNAVLQPTQPTEAPQSVTPATATLERRPSYRRPAYEYRLRRPEPTPASATSVAPEVTNDISSYGRAINRSPQTQTPASISGSSNSRNNVNFVRHDQTTTTVASVSVQGSSNTENRPQPQAVRNYLQANDFRRNVLPNVGPNVRVIAVRRSRQNVTTRAIEGGNGVSPSGRPYRIAYRAQGAATATTTLAPMTTGSPVLSRAQAASPNIPAGRLSTDTDGDGIPGEAGKDYPTFMNIPKTSFSCANMPTNGYYADTETSCQVVHLCQFGGTQDSFLCPNGTIFNQQKFSCQWWFEVDCANAPKYYGLNDDFSREPNTANELAREESPRRNRNQNQ